MALFLLSSDKSQNPEPQALSASFIHEIPGLVRTQGVAIWPGILRSIVRFVVFVAGRFICVSQEECAERHVFLVTSSHYPPASVSYDVAGVSREVEAGTWNCGCYWLWCLLALVGWESWWEEVARGVGEVAGYRDG
jgi:hypothetical protein